MINLENIELEQQKDSFDYKVRADFGGFLEDGFYVKCHADVESHEEEVQQCNEEIEVQCVRTIEVIDSVDLWLIEIFDSANKLMKVSKTLFNEIKNDIENEIIDKLSI